MAAQQPNDDDAQDIPDEADDALVDLSTDDDADAADVSDGNGLDTDKAEVVAKLGNAGIIQVANASGGAPSSSTPGGGPWVISPQLSAPGGGLTERQIMVQQIRQLAGEVEPHDRPSAQVLRLLADAVENARTEEIRAYAAAVDARGIAERLAQPNPIWGKLEVLRAALIFAPIGVTWFGLSLATTAYAKFVALGTADAGRPFLYLWEQGFPGVGVLLSFSGLALIDAGLILLLIVLSGAIHVGTDVRSPQRLNRVSHEQSRIGSLIGRASALSATSDMTPIEADQILAEFLTEEKRVYERALEQEQHLFDLSAVVTDLRQGAAALQSFGESTSAAAERVARSQDLILARLEAAAEREGQLAAAMSGLAARIGDAATGSGVIIGTAASAALAIQQTHTKILEQASQLVAALDAVRKAEQHATTAVLDQSNSMKTAGEALDKGAARIENAARALSTAGLSATPATVHVGGDRSLSWVAAAMLAVLLVIGTFAAFDRFYESDTAAYIREARTQALPLQRIQSIYITVTGAPANLDRTVVRETAIDVLVAAPRVERWLAQRTAPASVAHLAQHTRAAAQASRRAATSVASWLESPEGEEGAPPPPALVADLAFAEALLRDLYGQFALEARR